MERTIRTSTKLLLIVLMSISATTFMSGTSAFTLGDGKLSVKAVGSLLTLPKNIPEALKPPVPTKLLDVYFGLGFQEYVFNGTQWTLYNVSSYLLDKHLHKVGHHIFVTKPCENTSYPNWISYHPRSSVTARKIAVVPCENAIPLVLLQAIKDSGSAKYFDRAVFVQRLETRGGLPPDFSVVSGPSKGQVYRSGYSAVYAFYELICVSPPGAQAS